MRLINVDTLIFEEFYYEKLPLYVILSHTWASDEEEISFRHMMLRTLPDEPNAGLVKLRGCCNQAKKYGIGYVWIDTCYIDKTNSVELNEAINSMFHWYRDAQICYAYLSDFPDKGLTGEEAAAHFRTSRWFTRGWTLQELLVPRSLVFYNSRWQPLGTKAQLSDDLAKSTGIPREILLDIRDLYTASVAQRMSWAAWRQIRRKEDVAYCLLGIFGVVMPMIYGEGTEMAFLRLQQEILRRKQDHSILAWGLGAESTGRLLAAAPSDFTNSGDIVPRKNLAVVHGFQT